MIESVFRSVDVTPAERFARWYEMATRAMIPILMRRDQEADFQATVRNLDLGAVQVSELTYPPLRASRTPRLIRQSDPEVLQLWLTLAGTTEINQAGRAVRIDPQSLVLFDSSRPWHGRTSAVAGVMLQVPRALISVRSDALDQLTAVRIPTGEGLGALLSCHLIGLFKQARRYGPADIVRLSTITADLVAALCAHHLEADACLPPETRRQALQAQIHDFIHRHLGDPGLTPDTIAAAHHVSPRYLYKLFQDQGLAVADHIRRCRLERCRHDLTNPLLAHVRIHAIATRWGFPDGAHFSRVFRATYGITPRDYRKQTQRDDGGA